MLSTAFLTRLRSLESLRICAFKDAVNKQNEIKMLFENILILIGTCRIINLLNFLK
jgi:hypothetical protein